MDVDKTTPEIKKHLTANAHLSRKKVMIYNFLGGLSWGFGTVIGASVVVAIIGAILHALGFFDTFSNFLQNAQGIAPKR